MFRWTVLLFISTRPILGNRTQEMQDYRAPPTKSVAKCLFPNLRRSHTRNHLTMLLDSILDPSHDTKTSSGMGLVKC